VDRWFDSAWLRSAATARLRQRQWNCADGEEQKQVERTSNKVGFDGGMELLFHAVLLSIQFLNCEITFERDNPFYLGAPGNVNSFLMIPPQTM
jgi:hypothetical protein